MKATIAVVDNGRGPISTSWSTANCIGRRAHSSLPPHHLARKNNGMVNVLVKSTKVPRPNFAMHPIKTRNQLKKRAVPFVLRDGVKEGAEGEERQQSHISYAGNDSMPITTELKIVLPEDDVPRGTWPVFRMMVSVVVVMGSRYILYCDFDRSFAFVPNLCLRGSLLRIPLCLFVLSEQDESGSFRRVDATARNASTPIIPPELYDLSQLRSSLILRHPQFAGLFESSDLLRPSRNEYPDTKSTNTLLRAHRQMIRLRKMDTYLHNAQRQGRISFYMTHHGEEALHMGSGSALKPQDVILAQYREAGLLMWRGFTLEQFCNQCFSNDLDLGKGRQMPVHYGSRALNYQTISSPLGTQITQAVGAAYKFKLDALANPEREAAISIVYFGDGAASTVDFHSGCNFAATLKTPMIFFCRNNGYAISTPVKGENRVGRCSVCSSPLASLRKRDLSRYGIRSICRRWYHISCARLRHGGHTRGRERHLRRSRRSCRGSKARAANLLARDDRGDDVPPRSSLDVGRLVAISRCR